MLFAQTYGSRTVRKRLSSSKNIAALCVTTTHWSFLAADNRYFDDANKSICVRACIRFSDFTSLLSGSINIGVDTSNGMYERKASRYCAHIERYLSECRRNILIIRSNIHDEMYFRAVVHLP